MNNLVTTSSGCWSPKKAAVSLTLFSSAHHRLCFSPQSQYKRKLKPYTTSVVNSGLLGTTSSTSTGLSFNILGFYLSFSLIPTGHMCTEKINDGTLKTHWLTHIITFQSTYGITDHLNITLFNQKQ